MTDTLKSKTLYKIYLSIIKYTPMILACLQIIGTIFNRYNISSSTIACVGGTSWLFIGMLYIASIIFRFCYLYRLPLYYITLINILFMIDVFIGIPISAIMLFRLHLILFGIFIFIFVLFMYINRNNPKVDHLKKFCEGCCK